jgi:hypothetical protein
MIPLLTICEAPSPHAKSSSYTRSTGQPIHNFLRISSPKLQQ